MGSFSLAHWLIVAVVVLILFGRGKVSDIMGEFGRGIQNFRKGMAEEETSRLPPASPKVPDQTVSSKAGSTGTGQE